MYWRYSELRQLMSEGVVDQMRRVLFSRLALREPSKTGSAVLFPVPELVNLGDELGDPPFLDWIVAIDPLDRELKC